jgi:hypothetical protein
MSNINKSKCSTSAKTGPKTRPVRLMALEEKKMTPPKIYETRQEWKLFGSFIVLMIGSGVMFYGINRKDESVFLVLFAITAQIMAGIFACVSIRCPECGLK